MSIEGIDFSWSRPSVASIKAAGKKFVIRYLNQPGGKGLDKAELHSYVAGGLKVGFVYEEDGRELLGGISGATRIAIATKNYLSGLGASRAESVIYFAVDFQPSAAQTRVIIGALKELSKSLGKSHVGVYGGYDMIQAAYAAGACGYFWQTYAWSRGLLSPHANLYQYKNGQTIGGGSVDFCRALKSDFGAYGFKPVPTPKPVVVSSSKWSKIMYGFVRKTSNGEVAVVDPRTGQKRPLRKPEWLGYLANGAQFAELSDADYDSIPTAKAA